MGDFDILIQSTLANALLVFVYLGYKCCSRIIGSKCHYSRAEGLEITLADPDEHVDLNEINSFFASKGMTMRMRNVNNTA